MYATDDLRHEHEIILHLIDALEGAVNKSNSGEAVSLPDLNDMVSAIKVFADTCHHGKEEDVLFPALEKAGMHRQMGPLGVMLIEHDQGRTYVRKMTNALTELTDGRVNEEFSENALNYCALLRDHIAKENNILFVMAEQMLPSDEHARMKTEFDKIETEKIGEGVHEKLHSDVHRWYDQYAR